MDEAEFGNGLDLDMPPVLLVLSTDTLKAVGVVGGLLLNVAQFASAAADGSTVDELIRRPSDDHHFTTGRAGCRVANGLLMAPGVL